MTTNLGAKIIERESGIKPKSEQGEGGLKLLQMQLQVGNQFQSQSKILKFLNE